MEYRRLGRTGLAVGAIGLGTEYLLHAGPQAIDAVFGRAVEAGVNYVDLLYGLPTFNDDLAPALQGRREKLLLAAHLDVGEENGQPAWIPEWRRCEPFFLDTLARLRLESVDVLLLQMVDSDWAYEQHFLPLLEVAHRHRQAGRARLIAASSHKAPAALRVVESGLIDVLMFPVNLAGDALPGHRELYEACARAGVGLVAMKPYAGGQLLRGADQVFVHWVQAGGQSLEVQRSARLTPVRCLSYTLAQPAVATTVPGVKDVAQLETALSYLEAGAEARDYAALAQEVRRYTPGECFYCNHCLPCAAGIDIGAAIRLLDDARPGVTPELRAAYEALEHKSSECLACNECLWRCPSEVPVVERMREAAALFA